MLNEDIAKAYINVEVVNGIAKKSQFNGNVAGFKIVACTLVHLIAKSTDARTKDVLSEIINGIAFAENCSKEVLEQIEKIIKEQINE